MTIKFTALRIAAMSALAAVSIGGHAFAQMPTTMSPTPIARQTSSDTNMTSLIGIKVINDASEVVGDLNYVLVNASGQITTVVVGVGGFLGVNEKNVAFAFPSSGWSTNEKSDRVLKLNVTKAQLEAAPQFEWIEKPMELKVEDSLKSAAEKVKSTAKTLSDKASDAMKKN